MEDNTARQMATAVQLWLDFQIICGRRVLLSEAYLSQPVGEFLLSHNVGRVEAEWDLPNAMTGGPGRPKQIDYAVFSRDKHRPVSAIEAKWVAEQKSDKQRLLDDVLRLEFLRNNQQQHMTRFFLVAGKTTHFEDNFVNLLVNRGGGREDFLPSILSLTVDSQETHSIKNCNLSLRPLFAGFAKGYKVDLPTSYQSKLIIDKKGEHTRVMVWKINSVTNRRVFKPNDSWVKGT